MMKANTSGFCLIAIIIYICATTFIVILVQQFTISLYPYLVSLNDKSHSLLKLSAAMDLIGRDFCAACSSGATWKIKKESLRWKKGQQRIVWRYKKNRLNRFEGSYDIHKKEWVSNSVSLVVDSLSSCIFSVHRKGENIIGLTVCLTMTGRQEPLQCARTIAMRTGRRYEIKE